MNTARCQGTGVKIIYFTKTIIYLAETYKTHTLDKVPSVAFMLFNFLWDSLHNKSIKNKTNSNGSQYKQNSCFVF